MTLEQSGCLVLTRQRRTPTQLFLSKTLILGVLIVMIVRQDRSYWYDGRSCDQMVYVKRVYVKAESA